MRNKLFLLMMVLLSAALWGAVAVKNFTISQRWPWNGLVDITYSIDCEDANADVSLKFTARNNDRGTAVEMKTLTGDGASGSLKPGGPYRTVWNAGKDVPNALIKNLTISLTATATSVEVKHKLTCKLTPSTAKWTVNGSTYASGVTAELPEGTYTVSFSTVTGYVTPASQTVVLNADKNITVTYPIPGEQSSDYLIVDLSNGANATSYSVRASNTGPDMSNDTCRTTELWLRKIPAGTFTMGSPSYELGREDDDEGPQHQVTISKEFYMGVYEITQKQWQLVMGNNPSAYKGDCRPVEQVKYSDIRGSDVGAGWPASSQVDASSFMGKIRSRTGLNLDLPTEAEWEYACRAGTTTALNSGQNLRDEERCPNMAEVGRYLYNRSDGKGGYSRHTKVGCYKPNAWNLYDMHGNVYEWCLDWYDEPYSGNAVTDPVGPMSGYSRVQRGGSWDDGPAQYCRSAYRDCLGPNYYYDDCGFRLAVRPKPIEHQLSVNLSPSSAKWTVNGSTYYASGASIGFIESTYTVSFSSVAGYVTPERQIIDLTADKTITVNYDPIIHKLTYELIPPTARWTVNGSTYASGATVELPEGTYTVSFSSVDGYVTPESQTVTLTADKSLAVNYVPIHKLTCNLTPATAKWTVNGSTYASDATVELPEGTYTVSFADAAGYVTPESQTVELKADTSMTVNYVPIHKLTCNLTPATAKWTVNGNTYASGVSVELVEGTYTVSFTDVTGYVTPAPQSVVLNADENIPVTYPFPGEQTSDYLIVDLSNGANATSYSVRASNTGPDMSNDTCRTTELWLRKIPAGIFTMGSPDGELGRLDEEGPQHQVIISKAFYIGVFEVTQRQWELVMGNRPSYFSNDSCYATRPVEQVSYDDIRGNGDGAGWPTNNKVDASSFMGKIRSLTGLTFDLPTEAEWEYACRSGTTTALNSGCNLMGTESCYNMAVVGRYQNKDSFSYNSSVDTSICTAKVGSYRPNAWGLYDMHGNVEELCLDWYGSYSSNAVTDPVGADAGSSRLLRGGSWGRYAQGCRSANRSSNNPSYRDSCDGFRAATHTDMEPIMHKLSVNLTPPSAKWTVNGSISTYASGATMELPEGTYTVLFSAVIDYLAPVIQTVVLNADKVISVNYLKQEDYLVVDLSNGSNAMSYSVRCSSTGPDVSKDTCRTTELWLRKIPAGTFTMSSPRGERGKDLFGGEGPQHQVTISKDFYIGVFEVTQWQWELVMGNRPSYFSNDSCYATRPVEQVSYDDIRGSGEEVGWLANNKVDASSFMGRIRSRTGLTFDLPTEAEWEYACRAGTTTALNSGKNLTGTDSCSNMAEVGRYSCNGGYYSSSGDDTSRGTAKVGSYKPNDWGLYDMHGNVWEWCLDKGTRTYTESAVTDPVGPTSGSDRMVRGGGWFSDAQYCRSACRYNRSSTIYWNIYGFRAVSRP